MNFSSWKNAFKRCINTCTFHDNRLFFICSVDGFNQILEYFACTVYFHIHKHNERYNQ